MANVNRVFGMCAITLISSIIAQSDIPLIHLRLLCRSTIEVTCNMSYGNYGIWTFYRTQDGFDDKQNIVKIVSSEQCRLFPLQTTDTQCSCIEDNSVLCKISADMIVKSGDQWQCSRFINGNTHFSIPVTVPIQETIECTTITRLQPGTDEETTPAKITSLTVVSETIKQEEDVITVAEGHSHVTSEEFNKFTTTSGVKTETVVKVESEHGQDKSEWNKDSTKIIAAAAGVAIFVAINVSFCVYWKYKPRQVVINNTTIDNDDTTPKHIVVMPLISPDMYNDVNYHEISDIQRQFVEFATVKNTSSKARTDNANEPTFEDNETMELTPHILRRADLTLPESGTDDMDETAPVQISFLALAEINMSDVAALESQLNRTDVKSVPYESLESTLRADKDQYSKPV
ncbi:hypothetical protein DPMN_118767 [Dreissena polymorpha]|uniref:Uncharacterized protein n=2 Tax=Dreissena polymorpha TaxID=45954 RepID=A0A9D4JM74_DREPO|nr:hypothetical protein DPMN_118767 [Dreissena polymorpha]